MTQQGIMGERYDEAIHRLSQFAQATTFEDLPGWVIGESKRCLLDFLGVSIGASHERAVRIAVEAAQELGGRPQATMLPTGARTSMTQAALVNGIASHVLDFDDTHAPTILHGTGPTASAALAVAEWYDRAGRDLIAAHAIGYEVAARAALALFPESYDVGWHMTGTAGTFGAAVAAARLFEVRSEAWGHLIGAAATQAAGHREQFGAMTKSLHAGKAASNGLLAALLAGKGYTASPRSIGGPRGFLAVMTGRSDEEGAANLDADLGTRWELSRNGFKPYACGVVAHPAIDAVRALPDRYTVPAADVRAIELRVHPLVLELTGKPEPRTGLEGKFSVTFAAAIVLLEGAAAAGQFVDEKVTRPDVIALRDRIYPVVDHSLTTGAAIAVATLRDGRVLRSEVTAARGTPANPMSDQELYTKFHDLADPVIGAERAGALAAAISNLEELESVRALLEPIRAETELCGP